MAHPIRHLQRLTARRVFAAAPALVAALGLSVTASSTPRPDEARSAEAVARLTDGELSERGLRIIQARLDPAMMAMALRHDPDQTPPALPGLTPGWESLTLAGRPGLQPGASGAEARRLNAAMTSRADAVRPARPFAFNGSAQDRARALRCLSQAVYYEAALESVTGQEAVAQVVLNRVRDPNYPNTVCGVVFEGAERTTGCQFSFTCDGALAQTPVAWAWRRAQSVAERALSGHVADEVGTATHYHADYVHPWWAPSVTKIRQIGAHIFYRWNGALGDTSAFRQAHAGREPVIDEARFARPRLQTASVNAEAGGAAVAEATDGAVRTVEINGAVRVVGVASLGGRRQPTAQEVAAINDRLRAFEAERADATPIPAPEGVTVMDVEEVGRPSA